MSFVYYDINSSNIGNQNNTDDVSSDLPITIAKCPLCHGSGTILHNVKTNSKGAYFLSSPTQSEEKCSCCDGKGWVTQTQIANSKFCEISK
jgi:RecJ-like exonuclease